MNPLVLPDLEQLKDQLYLFRTITALLRGLNVFIGNVRAGQATLVAGAIKVTCPALTPTSLIVVGYARKLGTTGTLSVDPQTYDLVKKSFTILSSSGSDVSVITWHLLN